MLELRVKVCNHDLLLLYCIRPVGILDLCGEPGESQNLPNEYETCFGYFGYTAHTVNYMCKSANS